MTESIKPPAGVEFDDGWANPGMANLPGYAPDLTQYPPDLAAAFEARESGR